MNAARRLQCWARQNKARSFEIRYIGAVAKGPWAIDLNNNDTQATVHVEAFSKLTDAAHFALKQAEKEEAI